MAAPTLHIYRSFFPPIRGILTKRRYAYEGHDTSLSLATGGGANGGGAVSIARRPATGGGMYRRMAADRPATDRAALLDRPHAMVGGEQLAAASDMFTTSTVGAGGLVPAAGHRRRYTRPAATIHRLSPMGRRHPVAVAGVVAAAGGRYCGDPAHCQPVGDGPPSIRHRADSGRAYVGGHRGTVDFAGGSGRLAMGLSLCPCAPAAAGRVSRRCRHGVGRPGHGGTSAVVCQPLGRSAGTSGRLPVGIARALCHAGSSATAYPVATPAAGKNAAVDFFVHRPGRGLHFAARSFIMV